MRLYIRFSYRVSVSIYRMFFFILKRSLSRYQFDCMKLRLYKYLPKYLILAEYDTKFHFRMRFFWQIFYGLFYDTLLYICSDYSTFIVFIFSFLGFFN